MIAARLHDSGTQPVVEEIPEPRPGDGESLVEIEAAAVGHLDLTVAGGRFGHQPPLPYTPGTDGAGTIVRSRRFEPGTRVRLRGGGLGLARDGTWAERVAVPDSALHEVPPDVAPALVATFFSPCATASVAVDELGELRSGETVAVTGAAGAVGSIAVQLALRTGARTVYGLARAEKRTSVPAGAITDEPPRGVDLLIDTVGGPGLPGLLKAMRPGGRAVLVGYTAGVDVTINLPALLAADVRLLPLNLLNRDTRSVEIAAAMLELLRAGELVLPITTYPLARAADAVADLAAGRTIGRVALLP